MPLNLNLPPVRAKGDPGDFSDANLWRAAFLQSQSFMNNLELEIADIRATYVKGRVSVGEPAHDGSQEDNEVWIVE